MKPIKIGFIDFGLVRIPVKIYNATDQKKLRFFFLRKKDLCPIQYVRVCAKTGEEVAFSDIVRGYEYKEGKYVTVTDDDLERANVYRTRAIEVMNFVKEEEINPKYLEKPYFLEPEEGSRKSYALLREALKRSEKVGVVKFVIRTREHLGILKAEDNVIFLNQMRFDWEIKKQKELNLPKSEEITLKELDTALRLVDSLTIPFRPELYEDTYTDDLLNLIEEKAQDRLPPPKGELPAPTPEQEIESELEKSLDMAIKKTGIFSSLKKEK